MVQFWFWVTVVGLANDDEEERGDGNSGMGEEDEDDGVQLTPPQTDDPAAASRKGCTPGPCGQAWLIQLGRSSRI